MKRTAWICFVRLTSVAHHLVLRATRSPLTSPRRECSIFIFLRRGSSEDETFARLIRERELTSIRVSSVGKPFGMSDGLLRRLFTPGNPRLQFCTGTDRPFLRAIGRTL